MSKLTLTCDCGQEMLVPESALGRTGHCPACGRALVADPDRAQPYAGPAHGGRLLSMQRTTRRAPAPATAGEGGEESGWREFAEAVDLYNGKRYAESLALLNALHARHPDNPHVYAARMQCLRALQRSANALQEYDGTRVADTRLTPELVKSVVLDKMLHAKDEGVQLQAAELAARLLDLFPRPMTGPPPEAPEAHAAPPDMMLRPDFETPGSGAETATGAVSDPPVDPAPSAPAPPADPAPRRQKRGGRKAGRKHRSAQSAQGGG
jgi:hypothetical protein